MTDDNKPAELTTRSQAVARTINRTVSQQAIVISDCCQIVSPAVFEILGSKHIGVMTLTFQGHVTSSFT